MKSIMHPKTDRTCYLCMKLHGVYDEMNNLEEHHVFGGVANRPLSTKFGLLVYLCPGHHRSSNEAVHVNSAVSQMVHEDAQRKFQDAYPELDFVKIFGKNYIYEEPTNLSKYEGLKGFRVVESEEEYEQSCINW